MGMKVGDCWTAALCTSCHFEIDNGKSMTRDERRESMDQAILDTIRLLALNGNLRVTK
jgi:ferredoxin